MWQIATFTKNLKKQNQYLKSFDIFFKNTRSISTNDAAKVESELATLSYEQLKHLRYMKTVPSYIDDMAFAINPLKQIKQSISKSLPFILSMILLVALNL